MWEFILLLGSAIAFGLATIQVEVKRVALVALGLLLFVLVPLIHAGQNL